MAASTGIVLAAGAFPIADQVIIRGWEPRRGIYLLVGTVGAAFAAAAMDKVIKGLGTGTAVILLVAAALEYGPALADVFSEPSYSPARIGGRAPNPVAGNGTVTV